MSTPCGTVRGMEATTDTNPIDVIIRVQNLDADIAELETILAEKRAERAAISETMLHDALDALESLRPKVKRGRFTDDEIREFRRRAANGETPAALAREVRISGEAMRKIIHRVNYPDVT